MNILFGYRHADLEVDALLLGAAAVIIGLTILALAYWWARRALKTRKQDNLERSMKVSVVTLALVGLAIGVMVGGIIYANKRLDEQIRLRRQEEGRKKRDLSKSGCCPPTHVTASAAYPLAN